MILEPGCVWPIYVPSYGRAGKSLTLRWIAKQPHVAKAVYVCCELNEYDEYSKAYPQFHIICNTVKPKTIVGARQSMLEHARAMGYDWYWQIDDTVNAIGTRPFQGEKFRAGGDPLSALLKMQALKSLSPRLALISPDFRHLVWAEGEPFTLNTRCMVVTGTRTDTGISYDLNMVMKEDIDYCLALLQNGWMTLLSHMYEIRETAMGKNKQGGMTEKYAVRGFHALSCQQMARKWPNNCKLDIRRGRPEIKTSWRTFAPRKEEATA